MFVSYLQYKSIHITAKQKRQYISPPGIVATFADIHRSVIEVEVHQCNDPPIVGHRVAESRECSVEILIADMEFGAVLIN